MDHLMNPSDHAACNKDAVYRFMKNGAANWNKLLPCSRQRLRAM